MAKNIFIEQFIEEYFDGKKYLNVNEVSKLVKEVWDKAVNECKKSAKIEKQTNFQTNGAGLNTIESADSYQVVNENWDYTFRIDKSSIDKVKYILQ